MESHVALLMCLIQMCYRLRQPSLGCELHFLETFPIINQYIFIAHGAQKHEGKNIHIIICTLKHFSLCVLNFMLPACRTNFAEVARTS